ncbi:MAG: hypothetical protein AABY22_22660, partial [Nanoarchaeota archaeon]
MLNFVQLNKKENKGGLLVGKSHTEGGIDIKTPEGKIEAQGGEVVINKIASEQNCELLSEINQSAGGGVAFDCDNTYKHNDKAERGAEIPSNNYCVFFKSKLLNNIIYTHIAAESLNSAIKKTKSLYNWAEPEWFKGFGFIETIPENIQFFYEGIRQKNQGLEIGIKDGKIAFYGPNNQIDFDFLATYELKNAIKIFKGGVLMSDGISIDVDSDFNFDASQIKKHIGVKNGTAELGMKIKNGILNNSDVKDGIVLVSEWTPSISLFTHAGIISIEGGIPYVYDNDPDNPKNEKGGSPKRTRLDEYLITKKV